MTESPPPRHDQAAAEASSTSPADPRPTGGRAGAGRVAAGLRRLEPHSREVLDLSLRRRIPDDMLGRLFDTDGPEIARRRAGAIRELAEQLGVERGQELGRVLNMLLDARTWDALDEPEPPEAGEPRGARPQEERAGASTRRPLVGALAAAALAGLAAAIVALAQGGGDDPPGALARDAARQPRPFQPRPGPLGAPFPTTPAPVAGHITASVDRPVHLRERPGGRSLVELEPRTEFGSDRVLGVLLRRGGWLGVQAPELPNRGVGWLRTDQAKLGEVHFSLRVDLSARRLTVIRAGRGIRRLTVTVGGPGNPTPTGRFSVTDRLLVKDPSSPYGCCVLALTGHQPKLPPGWPGGDRLAIHANRDPATLGQARSLGCLRVDPGQARWLVDRVPLGTPVYIRA